MNLGMPEIVIIAIVVLLLFGGKKLPELMHGVGKGIRDFKRGVNGIEDEIKKDIDTADTPAKQPDSTTAKQEAKDTTEEKAS